jgi:hypothetical protein
MKRPSLALLGVIGQASEQISVKSSSKMAPQKQTIAADATSADQGLALGPDTLQIDDKIYSAQEIASKHPGTSHHDIRIRDIPIISVLIIYNFNH